MKLSLQINLKKKLKITLRINQKNKIISKLNKANNFFFWLFFNFLTKIFFFLFNFIEFSNNKFIQ